MSAALRLTASDRAALHRVLDFATDALRFATQAAGPDAVQTRVISLALGLAILERLCNSDDETTGDV